MVGSNGRLRSPTLTRWGDAIVRVRVPDHVDGADRGALCGPLKTSSQSSLSSRSSWPWVRATLRRAADHPKKNPPAAKCGAGGSLHLRAFDQLNFRARLRLQYVWAAVLTRGGLSGSAQLCSHAADATQRAQGTTQQTRRAGHDGDRRGTDWHHSAHSPEG
jgi:hypothetical protein